MLKRLDRSEEYEIKKIKIKIKLSLILLFEHKLDNNFGTEVVLFCVDADGPLTCPIHASIEEIMVVLTLAVGATPRSLLSQVLFQGTIPRQQPLKLLYLTAHTSN
jgi:hypothetical protein